MKWSRPAWYGLCAIATGALGCGVATDSSQVNAHFAEVRDGGAGSDVGDVVDALADSGDSGQDLGASGDGGMADAVTDADGGDSASSCVTPGGDWCPCDDHADCDSGLCALTADGGVCAAPCTDANTGGCRLGWSCATYMVASSPRAFCGPDGPPVCDGAVAPCVAAPSRFYDLGNGFVRDATSASWVHSGAAALVEPAGEPLTSSSYRLRPTRGFGGSL